MFYEPDKRNHNLKHDPYKSLIVPRPIGWISTVDESGVPNLAPYSYFNGVATNPPIVMFASVTDPSSAQVKDSQRNAEATGEFVVNLATFALREQMNRSSAPFDRHVDEFRAAGLESVPSRLILPPRVKESPVHLECKYLKTVELPHNDPRHRNSVVFGRVVAIHIDDSLIVAGRVEIARARPLARLGYWDYTAVETVFGMEPPV